MSTPFQALGPNYLISVAADSSNFQIEIDNTNNIGSALLFANLDSANVVYVSAGFDSGATEADTPPGSGVAVLPQSTLILKINTNAAATGPLYIAAASAGEAQVVVTPGAV
jgi:hypothetical protein